MKILGLEKVSFVDFNGKICATIFTGGCNFKCPYCHNSGIVENSYSPFTEEDVLNYLESRKNLLDAVTISGGEPTLQPDLKDFIYKVKNMGFLVKLDTNGTNPQMLEKLINEKIIDYVAMDIKTNFDNYKDITKSNVSADFVKQSLNILKKNKIEYELRTTLVKEYHLKENIEKMSKDLKGENKLYLQKFKSGENCFEKNLNEVSKERAKEYQNLLSKYIKNVFLRGY